MNCWTGIGRLVKDGEYRETNDGLQIYRFTMAVDRETKKDGGDKADFPRVTVFGKQAENCNKFIGKGSLVAVKGRLQTGSYEDKNGNKVYTTDVVADRVEFLSYNTQREEPQQATFDTYQAIDENVPF